MRVEIRTQDDLVKEKQRLSELLKIQRNLIRNDLKAVQNEFEPITKTFSFVSKFTNREEGQETMVKAGTNLTIDLLMGKILSNSNGVVKWLLPVLLKNFSSHYIPKALPVVKKAVKENSAPKKVAPRRVSVPAQ